MRITRDQLIAGYPAFRVRALMRATNWAGEWGTDLVASIIEIDEAGAAAMVAELNRLGYIERADRRSHECEWQNTTKGSALGSATATRPIKRATAERLLKEFLDRVTTV